MVWRRPVRSAWCVFALVCFLAFNAAAEPKQRAIGFSNLVFRLDGEDAIGILKEDFRVRILEQMRTSGLAAVGAESLVFGKDHADAAELLLGGTVRELVCQEVQYKGAACRLGIEWELLDVRRDVVIYRTLARAAEYQVDLKKPTGVATHLVLGALRSLTRRARFRALLTRSSNPTDDAVEHYAPAQYRACAASHQPMPAGAEAALDATVVVKTDAGFGSGFFLNADGYVITAAHVVADAHEITVKTRAGTSLQTDLIRISRRLDVALLRVKEGAAECLVVDPAVPAAGSDVYAIGSPASEQLAFSVTRGIVSGARTFDDVPFLQTDASISPGNSGGPLVDQAGKVVAIVSWKIIGDRVAGLAFGVPAQHALDALSLSPGPATSEALLQPLVLLPKDKVEVSADAPDPVPPFDPELAAKQEADRAARERARREVIEAEARATRERAQKLAKQRVDDAIAEERQKRLDAITPRYIKPMKWGGAGLALAGGVTALVTYLSDDDQTTTRSGFEHLRLGNDIGWIALGLGAATVTTAFILTPRLPPDSARAKSSLAVELASSQVRLRLCY